MKRTAVIYFEDLIRKRLADDPDYVFDVGFFEDPNFPARPNSTLRLTLVNFAAFQEISRTHPVDIFHYREVVGGIRGLLSYDQIVLNTVASKKTEQFLRMLIPLLDSVPTPPRVIIGTEYSWTNNVKTGNISQELVDSLYLDHLMLRHTARTDKHLYEDPKYRSSRVQEFELGIDMQSMPEPFPIEVRTDILFVSAPEGRVTKNNGEIWEIIEELERSGVTDELAIKVLEPPYTTREYWEYLRSARFVIFTSLGETFSYVLNDALAMGVVGLRRPELFATRTSRFGVDSYWDVGIRYEDPKDAAEIVLELSRDGDSLLAESSRAAAIARRRFSKDTVRHNWLKVLRGSSLNTESVYIVDISRLRGGISQGFAKARDLGCKYVIAYMSRGLEDARLTSYSLPSSDRSQVVIPYCYMEYGGRIRIAGPNMGRGRIVEASSFDDVVDYLRLVVRSHKIRAIYVDANVDDDQLIAACEDTEYLDGGELVPAEVQSLG